MRTLSHNKYSLDLSQSMSESSNSSSGDVTPGTRAVLASPLNQTILSNIKLDTSQRSQASGDSSEIEVVFDHAEAPTGLLVGMPPGFWDQLQLIIMMSNDKLKTEIRDPIMARIDNISRRLGDVQDTVEIHTTQITSLTSQLEEVKPYVDNALRFMSRDVSATARRDVELRADFEELTAQVFQLNRRAMDDIRDVNNRVFELETNPIQQVTAESFHRPAEESAILDCIPVIQEEIRSLREVADGHQDYLMTLERNRIRDQAEALAQVEQVDNVTLRRGSGHLRPSAPPLPHTASSMATDAEDNNEVDPLVAQSMMRDILNETRTLQEDMRRANAEMFSDMAHRFVREIEDVRNTQPTAKKKSRASSGGDHGGGDSSSSDDNKDNRHSFDRGRSRKPRRGSDSSSGSSNSHTEGRGRSKTRDVFKSRRSKSRRSSLVDSDPEDDESHGTRHYTTTSRLADVMSRTDAPIDTPYRSGALMPDTWEVINKLTEKDLFLAGNPPDFHAAVLFIQKVDRKQTSQRTAIKTAGHINEPYLKTLETTIEKNKGNRFASQKDVLRSARSGGKILWKGVQLLTNAKLMEVIIWDIRPKTQYQLEQIMLRSVFPADAWPKFQTEEAIRKDLRGYMYSWIAFVTNFEILLDMLTHSKRFFPKYLFKKHGNEGLIDQMFKHTPCPKFSYRVLRRGIPEDKRSDSMSWQEFLDAYVTALEKQVKDIDAAQNATHRFSDNTDRKCLPPMQYEKRQQYAERNSSGNHNMKGISEPLQQSDEQEEPDVHSDVQDEYDDDVDEGHYRTAEDTDGVQRELADEEEQFQSEIDEDLAPTGDEFDFLRGLASILPGKVQVCFSYANNGKCAKEEKDGIGTCRYSHDPRDVQRFHEAKKAGPDNYQKRTSVHFGQGKSGSSSAGPSGNSGGIRAPFVSRNKPAPGYMPTRPGVAPKRK